jgi:two-component system chemotaxis sensor kinase CheA
MSMDNSLNGKTVLIVDDEERNVFALGAYLESQNMNVLSAGNGKDALRMMRSNGDINIVLLDMMMPVMDGYEVAAVMKNDEALRGIPCIALTARAMKGDMEKCLEAGVWDYVSKPADVKLLIAKMNQWLR